MNNIKKAAYEPESWHLMSSMKFSEMSKFINMYPKWSEWSYVKKNYSKSILKPVNMYVANFSDKPEIIKKSNTEITIKYYTHSDILVLIPDPPLGNLGIFKSKPIYAIFYATDKLWQRQFYPCGFLDHNDDNLISNRVYKFYIPWFLDIDTQYKIKSSLKNSSFKILTQDGFFTKTNKNVIIKEANFVEFCFTKSKLHMLDDLTGIIKKGSYMFEIDISSDKSTIKKIIKGYEKI